MSQPEWTTDVIDQANALFWNPPPLDELMADVAPVSDDERSEIEDVTDEEWQAFTHAVED